MKKIEIIETLTKYGVNVDSSEKYNVLVAMLKEIENRARANDIAIEYATISDCVNDISKHINALIKSHKNMLSFNTKKHRAYTETVSYAYCGKWNDYERAIIIDIVNYGKFEMWLHVLDSESIDVERVDFCIDDAVFNEMKRYISDDTFSYSLKRKINNHDLNCGYKSLKSYKTCTNVFDGMPIEYALDIYNAFETFINSIENEEIKEA